MRIIRADDRPVVPAAHENPADPGVWKRVLVQRDDLQAGRVQMVNWARLPANRSFAPHYHEDMQEVFIILRGTVELAADSQCVEMGPGDTVVIEAREVHQMWNRGVEDAEYLALGISGERGGRTVLAATPVGTRLD